MLAVLLTYDNAFSREAQYADACLKGLFGRKMLNNSHFEGDITLGFWVSDNRGTIMAEILIVDDSISMRQMVSYTLKNAGHDIFEASDGEQGLKETRQQQFDLVITVVNMPAMDGITLVSPLRKLPGYKYIPILCLTTESDSDVIQQGKMVGATGWLGKPFDPDQLVKTVEKVLD